MWLWPRWGELDACRLILSAATRSRPLAVARRADDSSSASRSRSRCRPSLLRRAHADGSGRSVAGPLWVDLDRRRATANSNALELSRREFDLLSTFVANPGIVLSRIRLLELVWGYDFDVDTNVVDVFVGYLRRKLEAAGLPKIIETVRGVGFVLRIP